MTFIAYNANLHPIPGSGGAIGAASMKGRGGAGGGGGAGANVSYIDGSSENSVSFCFSVIFSEVLGALPFVDTCSKI